MEHKITLSVYTFYFFSLSVSVIFNIFFSTLLLLSLISYSLCCTFLCFPCVQFLTKGCETSEMTLRRNGLGQLGFHVNYEGIVAEVSTDHATQYYSTTTTLQLSSFGVEIKYQNMLNYSVVLMCLLVRLTCNVSIQRCFSLSLLEICTVYSSLLQAYWKSIFWCSHILDMWYIHTGWNRNLSACVVRQYLILDVLYCSKMCNYINIFA